MPKQQLPKAVRRQVNQARKIAKEAGLNYDGGELPVEDAETKPSLEVVASSPDALLRVADDEPAPAPVETPEVLAPVETPEAPAPVEPSQEVPENFEQQYRSLQGKYSADMRELQFEVKNLGQQLSALSEKYGDALKFINDNTAAPATATEAHPIPAPQEGLGPTEEEVEDFGEELISVVRKTARSEFLPVIEELRKDNARIHNELQQFGGAAQQVAKRQTVSDIHETLDQQVPEWRKLNRDNGFLAWLSSPDPMLGSTKQEALTHAFEQGDITRVVAFFRGYQGIGAQAIEPQPTPAVDLALVAAPAASVGGGMAQESTSQEPRTWTRSQIAEHFKHAAQGHFVGQEVEQRQIERDILAANREGRIR